MLTINDYEDLLDWPELDSETVNYLELASDGDIRVAQLTCYPGCEADHEPGVTRWAIPHATAQEYNGLVEAVRPVIERSVDPAVFRPRPDEDDLWGEGEEGDPVREAIAEFFETDSAKYLGGYWSRDYAALQPFDYEDEGGEEPLF